MGRIDLADIVRSRFHLRLELPMTAGYFRQGGEQIYHTRFVPEGDIRARAILAGPFASDRHATYVNMTRWAECLALCGFEVLRFDYRGHGESTGRFEETSFPDWYEDLALCADRWSAEAAGTPLLVHGLQLGALLAERLFRDGTGDALLRWAPPPSARRMLFDLLRLRLASDVKEGRPNRSRDEYIADLESGRRVEVNNYWWTGAQWADAAAFESDEEESGDRPRKSVRFPRYPHDGAGVFDPKSWEEGRIDRTRLGAPFRESLEWLGGAMARRVAP